MSAREPGGSTPPEEHNPDEWRRQAAGGQLGPGHSLRFSRTFTEQDVAAFGEMTRDANPVHSDPGWWRLKGFDGPICHGLLVGSMLCMPGGQWGWLATGMSFKFLLPTYVGDTITCEMTIDEVDERGFARATAILTNHGGATVMTAELTGYLPDEGERARLCELVDVPA